MKTRYYFVYKFLKDLMPIYPVYLLMFEANGMSLSKISFLLALWSLSVVLTEVPTGVLSDHWNRKNMLLLGALLKALGFIVWFFSDSFLMFALGFIFWGASESFCSGSEEALLYDNLKEKNQEEEFGKVYGKGGFYSGVAVALSCLVGGFLASTINYQGVLLISALISLLSAIFILQFKEVNYFKENVAVEEESRNPLSTLLEAVILCGRNKRLLLVILMLIFVIGTVGLLDEFDPIIAEGYHLDLGIIGIWISSRYLLEAVGAKVAYQMKKFFLKLRITDDFKMVFILSILAVVFLMAFGFGKSVVFIPLYGFFYLLMASAGVLQEEFVQQTIEEQGRSTVHSVISLVHNIYGILFCSLAGIFILQIDILDGVGIVAIYMLVLSVLLYVLFKYHLRGYRR